MKIQKKIMMAMMVGLMMLETFVPAGLAAVGTKLAGVAFSLSPMAKASITIVDASGKEKSTAADGMGAYSVDITEMKAPLLINAVEPEIPNFSDESRLRGKSVAAIIGSVVPNKVNTANINPLSDRVVSDVAKSLGFKGPVGLILSGKTEGISAELIKTKTDGVRSLVLQALKDAGVVDAATWDPVTSKFSKNVESVLELIRHNRGYDTGTGQIGDAMLFDINFRPLSFMDPLNYKRAKQEKAALADKNIIHIYLAGDSTCSYYESERAPRAGWGQVFQSKFKDDAKVMVINAAQSGRSSRTFINEGWFRMIEDTILPGDYLFIQFGHNDEKCGSLKPAVRDQFDIANTATYPNDAAGKIQGGDEMSFQRWLEKYIISARNKKAVPVLLTPTTRMVYDKNKKKGVLPLTGSVHVNTPVNSGSKYFGDYSQTIRDTAKANNVALIDIDVKTVAMANAAGEPGWKKLWLAVDPAQYPFYKPGITGNIDSPDTTHFQLNGASKVADLVIEGFKENPALSVLAKLAK